VSEDLIRSLRESAEELPRLLGSLPEGSAGPPSRDGWSAAEVTSHLADFEMIAGARIRAILTLDRPFLPAYDQERFTARFGALGPPEESLERFLLTRRATLRVLEALATEEWDRRGVHPVRGEEPLRRTIEMLVRHDREHQEQIRQTAGGQGAARG
jgi:hypothetical protein